MKIVGPDLALQSHGDTKFVHRINGRVIRFGRLIRFDRYDQRTIRTENVSRDISESRDTRMEAAG